MSILNQTTQEESLEAKVQRTVENIKRTAAQNYQILSQFQKRGIQIVWDNPQGLTPQQIVEGLGKDAVKIFDFHGELTEAIIEIATIDGVTPDIELPKKNFTRNQDGTITILDSDYGT